jgi:hypothetical protein
MPFLHSIRDKARAMLQDEPLKDMFRKRHWAKPENITGIRNQDSRQESQLGSKTVLGRIFSKASIRLRKMSGWRLWRGQPPLKRKKQPLTTD